MQLPIARVCRLGALLAAVLAASLVGVAPAAAATSRDGWGFAIADDDWEWDNPGHLPSLEDRFADLAPRAFRFQMIWNAADLPWHMDRARSIIARARAQGVEQIVVTFKKSVGQDVDPVYGSQPTAAGYAEHVGEVVRQLAGDVDVWGPANEPNRGEAWLPGVAGAQRLAEYYASLQQVVETWDPTAEITSPDFVDRTDLGTIAAYVNAYEAAGGGWGDHVAWHPYWGTHTRTAQTTLDLIGLAPPGAGVWITEVGAFGRDQRTIEATETSQNDTVWWLATTLAGLAQVERIHYYHMRGNPQASWDTGLMNVDSSPRLAWHTWCAMARGMEEPACQPVTPPSPAPPGPPPPPGEPPPPPAEPPPDQSAPPLLPPSPPLAAAALPAAGCQVPGAAGCEPGGAAPASDRTPPTIAITGLTRRLTFGAFADGVTLRVRTSEPSALVVELAVAVRRADGRSRFRRVAGKALQVDGGRRIRLVPRLTALPAQHRFVVRVRVRATDRAGHRAAAGRRIRVTAGGARR